MSKQSVPFQAEVKEILNLMIHSLYSKKEIFLRELISNASDALDKLRFESLTHKEWELGDEERCIVITPDSKSQTLKVQDNGIGMSHEEVVQNIGTIARSGTREFLAAKKDLQERPELIGQFGVGFYSSFIVADRVILHTQKAGETQGTVWESTGDGTYTISEAPRPEGHGTTIVLHLKNTSSDGADNQSTTDFCQEWTLKGIIKKYSDFISFPIKLRVSKKTEAKESEDAKEEIAEETVNSQKALWLKNPTDVSEEEYKEFYHHIAHDWSEPFRTIHFKAEGTQEFSSLMFIPKNVPFDYNYRESKNGLNLYIRRVFIMEHCEDLQPHYLRFVKGLVDSADLPLNVSREILQKDPQAHKIQKALTTKVLNYLRDLLSKERSDYESFWTNFGSSLKEGFLTDFVNKEKLIELLLFQSNTSSSWTSVAEYVERMKSDQKDIYYLTGDSLETLKSSPYLERLNAKGYEVLFLTETIDEWLARELSDYKGKKFVSITAEDLDLDSEEEKKVVEEELKEAKKDFADLKTVFESILKDQVKEVRLTSRLTESAVCLVSPADDPSARMERLMGKMGQEVPRSKRILEINAKHPIFKKISAVSGDKKSDWVEVLYNQALLNEGSPLSDPARFSRQINQLLVSETP